MPEDNNDPSMMNNFIYRTRKGREHLDFDALYEAILKAKYDIELK